MQNYYWIIIMLVLGTCIKLWKVIRKKKPPTKFEHFHSKAYDLEEKGIKSIKMEVVRLDFILFCPKKVNNEYCKNGKI
ncbi:hypothetical protein AS180_08035 [Priestia veravalensis]|uniref:Uncharacterized protein n=1 Tax=Priestia veravalensis TaxID=1414648 RepID=A0A0V8JN41_9BACI|nr:hypothetical protein AS180_08035 [Priestia veravalensis]